MMKLNTLLILIAAGTLSACSEVKDVGKTIGHGTKDVAKSIGAASRDAAKLISKNTKKVISDVTSDSEE